MTLLSNKDSLVQDTLRTLHFPDRQTGKLAILLLAAPGTGKFEIADRLEKELKLIHLRADEVRRYLKPDATTFDRLDQVSDLLLTVMVELTRRGYSSVLDRNVNRKGYREKFRLEVEAVGGRVVEIEIECPDEVAFGNLSQDNTDIVSGEHSGNILDRQYWEFKKSQLEPTTGEQTYKLSCQYSEDGWQTLVNFLKIKLTST